MNDIGYSLVIFILVAIQPMLNAQDVLSQEMRKQIETEIWEIVEARNVTWKENDYEGHMAIYHPDFRRWSLHGSRLLTKADFASFWDAIKNNERVIHIKVIPEEIQILNKGSVAIAHYTIKEKYEWIGNDRTLEDGSKREKGDQLQGKLRFSDIYVKERGKWLYTGGHRDGASVN